MKERKTRVRMVTRTIEVSEVNYMALNTATCEVVTDTVSVNTLTEDKALEVVKKVVDTEDLKVVKITSIEKKEILYGMSEEDFVKNAKILPPRVLTKSETED